MYNGKNGNIYYYLKPIGEPMPKLDRCLMGFTFSILVLGILCGPLLLFSPMAGFVAPNPVLSGDIDISFLISKVISNKTMDKYLSGNVNELEEYDSLNLVSLDDKKNEKNETYLNCENDKDDCSKIYYGVYKSKNPEFRTLNKDQINSTKFHSWTESRFFYPDQIQLCLLEEFSQTKWQMSG